MLLAGSFASVTDNSLQWGRPLWEEYTSRLTQSPAVPGIAVHLPRFLIPLVLTRDPEVDADNSTAALSEIADYSEEVANLYKHFLNLVTATRPHRAAARALVGFSSVNPASMPDYINAHPEIASGAALQQVQQAMNDGPPPGESDLPLRARLHLVQSLHNGEPIALSVERYLSHFSQFRNDVLAPRIDRLVQILATDESATTIPQARELLSIARSIKDVDLERQSAHELAVRLLRMGERTQELLDEAISLLEHVDVISTTHDSLRLLARTNLGTAYVQSQTGSPDDNWRRSCELLREAVDASDRRQDPQQWSTANLNLGLTLASKPGGSGPGELSQALKHLSLSLKERSPERNLEDWCYTQVNLGHVYALRGSTDDLRRSNDCYREVAKRLAPADNPILWAIAQCNLAGQLLTEGPHSIIEAQEVANAVINCPSEVPRQSRSRAHRVLATLADKDASGLSQQGASHRRLALDLLDPRITPSDYLMHAVSLIDYLQSLDAWDEVADLYERLIIAFDVLYDLQLTPEGRQGVLDSHPRLHRWSSYAMARAGRLERAVEVVEAGRARQLSTEVTRDYADLQRLALYDANLSRQYGEAWTDYRLSLVLANDRNNLGWQLGAEGMEAERHFQHIVDTIREIPTFENFLAPFSAEDIANATAGLPVIYIVAAPRGCYSMMVTLKDDGSVEVSAQHVEDVTSASIVRMILVDPDSGLLGILLVQNMANEEESDSTSLEAALSRAMEHLRPLGAALMAQADGHEVVVVATGLLGLMPMHAIPISTDDTDLSTTKRVLDDVTKFSLTPSAAMYAASRHRATRAIPNVLVAVADTDPLCPLAGATAEIAQIMHHFPEHESYVQTGPQASLDWLMRNATHASHLHLACHGVSRLDDPYGGSLALGSNTELSVRELYDRDALSARVVIASACQSGVYASNGSPDEFVGLATGFLRAGAACAIVSLWPVGDESTALLMSRFYEYLNLDLPASRQQPGAALRRARLWLRNLTSDEAAEYLTHRPILDEALRAAHLPRRRSGATQPGDRPYSSLECWAPFIAYGA